jgi:hypothetical protein
LFNIQTILSSTKETDIRFSSINSKDKWVGCGQILKPKKTLTQKNKKKLGTGCIRVFHRNKSYDKVIIERDNKTNGDSKENINYVRKINTIYIIQIYEN